MLWILRRLVDFGHIKCEKQNPCLILNCPFGRFNSEYNYICKNVGELENGEKIDDKEVIQQKVFENNYEVRARKLYIG